jgi:hypothetical protein
LGPQCCVVSGGLPRRLTSCICIMGATMLRGWWVLWFWCSCCCCCCCPRCCPWFLSLSLYFFISFCLSLFFSLLLSHSGNFCSQSHGPTAHTLSARKDSPQSLDWSCLSGVLLSCLSLSLSLCLCVTFLGARRHACGGGPP